MALAGLGRFGLWLHLHHGSGVSQDITLPEGQGPLLFIGASPPCQAAAALITETLRKKRPDLRVHALASGDLPDPDKDRLAMRKLLDRGRPCAVLLLGTELPAALIVAAVERHIPVVLGEAKLGAHNLRWTFGAGMRRNLLNALTMLFVTDTASHETARRIGIPPGKVTVSGPITDIHDPLPCNEAELSELGNLLNGRHSWLAACIPAVEEEAVLAAHLAALRQTHRTLLFLVPASAERAAHLTRLLEDRNLIVAQRSRDEEPVSEVQVLIADTTEELGLWYRLAPVTYLGGTLSGEDQETRHPFEPAALGSAIVHGPSTDRFSTAWQQLDGGNAARTVTNADDLATAIAELTQPEMAAELASNAWTVGTGGAGAAMQVATYTQALIEKAGK